MNKITLGFITGCLNKQKSIFPECLYHQQILKIIKQEYSSYQIETVLGSYISYGKFQKTSQLFIENKEIDFLFIFLRPFPLMPLNKPIFKYKNRNDKIVWSIHPSLFRRNNFYWDEKYSRYEKEIGVNSKLRKRFELRDLNLMIGLLLGLNSWSTKFLVKNIKSIYNNVVNGFEKKLFFVSLPKNPESIMGNYICKITNRKIKRSLLKENQFIDISCISKDCFEKDGIHFNAYGHEQIAKILCPVILDEIDFNNN